VISAYVWKFLLHKVVHLTKKVHPCRRIVHIPKENGIVTNVTLVKIIHVTKMTKKKLLKESHSKNVSRHLKDYYHALPSSSHNIRKPQQKKGNTRKQFVHHKQLHCTCSSAGLLVISLEGGRVTAPRNPCTSANQKLYSSTSLFAPAHPVCRLLKTSSNQMPSTHLIMFPVSPSFCRRSPLLSLKKIEILAL
jgi:hypothetical protein